MTTIAAIDAGNGGVNALIAPKPGKPPVYDCFPAWRASVTGDSFGAGFELEYAYYDYAGGRYIVGDECLTIPNMGIERHVSSERYGGEFHQFMAAVALAREGIGKGSRSGELVKLVVFAPPGLYSQAKVNIQAGFMSDNGQVEIMVSGERKARKWQYESVTVLPEGGAAALSYALTDQGKPDPAGAADLAGRWLVLDFGAYTLDSLIIVNGQIAPGDIQSATLAGGGVHKHILSPLTAALRQRGGDWQGITPEAVDNAIRADYEIVSGGACVDLTAPAQTAARKYAGYIANSVIDGQHNALNGYNGALLIGGGAGLVYPFLSDWYGGKIKPVSADPARQNVTGGFRYALYQQGNG